MRTGRPRSDSHMEHTAIVLPPALRERLKKSAAAARRGLSAEIRERLLLSFMEQDTRFEVFDAMNQSNP